MRATYLKAIVVGIAVSTIAASLSMLPASTASASAIEAPDPLTIDAPNAPSPIEMDCGEGEVDVNSPSLEAFDGLITPDGELLSAPVRQRILDAQPYIQPTDLLAVEGVTKDHINQWLTNGLVCAEPTELPPPIPDPCDGDEVDVNNPESYDSLRGLYGRPTAQRVVDGAPYPSVVNALRIAGVGPGRIKRTSDLLCAQPYPIRHAGVDWAFATGEDGVALDTPGLYGHYTLTVPSDVVDGYGAWVSVTEREDPALNADSLPGLELQVPSVDADIHGNWDGFVGVTLPKDPTDLGDGYRHAVFHHSSVNGLEIHSGPGLAETADGRVVVAVDDLSPLDSISIAGRWLGGIGNAAVDGATWLEQKWRDAMGIGTSVSCDPDLTGANLPGGEQFTVQGQMLNNRPLTPPLDHCVTRVHGENQAPDVRFGVNRGIVNIVDSQSGVTIHDVNTVDSLVGIVFQLVNESNVANGGPKYVAPGGSFLAHLDGYRGSFHVETDILDYIFVTAIYWLMDELGSLLPPGLPQALNAIFNAAPNCAVQLGGALGSIRTGESEALAAATNVIVTLFSCLEEAVSSATPQEVTKWFIPDPNVGQLQDTYIFLERMKRAVKVLTIAKFATVALDVAGTIGLDGDVSMTWRPVEPADPTVDGQGRPIVPGCFSKRFSLNDGWVITIDGTCQDLAYGEFPQTDPPQPGPIQDAFDDWVGEIESLRLYNVLRRDAAGTLHLILLDDGELVAHPISSVDEWNFKEDWPEDEWRSDEFDDLVDRVGSPAVNDPLLLRNFSLGRGHSWLLREANGTAWYIDPDGIRSRIPTVEAQQAISNGNLTLHPAQWANDICPYSALGDPAVRVCG